MIRKIVLFILKEISFDFYIRHHFTKKRFFLNVYKHKGYWYKGKSREKDTMKSFEALISKGDFILEIGGHIGYLTTYFSFLTGSGGRVIVFEPGENNLPYLIRNVGDHKNITIIEKGAGDKNEFLDFYIENLTGQNNSFVENFSGFEINKAASIEKEANCYIKSIEVVKIDDFIKKYDVPNLIKIDVEGFEYKVLKGATDLIKLKSTIFMVEIQDNFEEIYILFVESGYSCFFENNVQIKDFDDFCSKKFGMNRFFIPNSFNSKIANWIK